MPSGRRRAFALLVVACLVGMAAAVASALREAPGASSPGAAGALRGARADGRTVVLFRSLAPAARGRTGLAEPAAAGGSPAALTGLTCDRVHFGGGNGLCLTRGTSFGSGYRARIFGADLRVRREIPVAGIPSRARVSPDGRWGAVTMFVTGHSYADAGAFSTRTTIIDMAQGRPAAELEQFSVTHAGRLVTAVDVNFWGVTFAGDGDRFYATLATGGRTHLVEGSLRARTMRTLHPNVECPSLSPDGTRVAYKKRTGTGRLPWRLTVLDLATMRETPLAETRGIDDQAEWLDDGRVLYGLDGDVRVVAADGSGRPRRFRAAAESPAVVRWSRAAEDGRGSLR